ncbi:VCBS repeat-containing protein [Streptomyces sp. NBC_01275]|uniref:FG-GAP repeat domain-containing protein n=1 Tax=Streptomyces sp. NBC_01275 TaxID=2903807 RepID=UPI002253F6D0|nr:VCBS repeat-containing protein [Streptomyces sp. NBC_01275]MCX4763216.1 VCBS repeat-containing protein [Streptomyces sp. NBC_01275]
MTRHAFVRLRLVAASAVLAAGLSPLLPSTAVADGAQETVVPAALRTTYTSGSVYGGSSYDGHDGAGAQGVFHSLEGSGLVWTRYADGTSVKVVHPTGYASYATAGGDVLAYRYADGRVDLWNASDDTTRTIRTPEGLTFLTAYGDLGVAFRSVKDDSGTTVQREMHLLLPEADGSTRDVPVTGVPEGYILGQPKGGDADGLLFQAGQAGGPYASVMVDRRTGQVQGWTPPRSKVLPRAQVTADHVVLFDVGDPTVQVFSRSDLSAAPVEVALDGGGTNPAQNLAVVGDWLVTRPGTAVIAKPIAGGPSKTLLPASNVDVSAVSDGSAVAVGRTAAAQDDWGVQRIRPGADGSPAVTLVKALPKPPYKIQGLSLDQGRLVVADRSHAGFRDTYGRTVAATGTPTFGERSSYDGTDTLLDSCSATDVGCSQLFGTAGGPTVWLERESEQYDRIRVNGPDPYDFWEVTVPAGGRVTDVSGGYVLYTTSAQQYVYRIDSGTPVVTRTPGPAALSGDVLWTAGAAPGTVTAYDLTTKKTVETLTTDAGCSPTELQALGRWLYWNCGDQAGVYDRTAKKSVPVPADEAKLGDGYVVTHDKRAGKLTLTTVADGTAVSRVIGELPDTGVSQRDVRWTVDESGANAAYVDAEEQVHLVPSGVAQQPLRLLETPRISDQIWADASNSALLTDNGILLSKPAASWQLTIRDKTTGKVVAGRSGGPVRGGLPRPEWNGTTGSGYAPNGLYDWTISVTPADGVGAPLTVKGTVRLHQGGAVHHDYLGTPSLLPDGVGDLVTVDSDSRLNFHQGTGSGTFSRKVGGWGWGTKITPVPVGDLNGDRCNDLLLRMGDGSLRLYKPGCVVTSTQWTSYTSLGTGWNQYDVLTAPGDVTKDGRPDLIARNAKTGTVYLYKGTSTGRLAARVKLYADWKTYKKVVGAGDLNGDGVGDLVAQDKADNLYRYYGTGKGTFGARVKVAAGWGGTYNAVVGAGDVTGDGKADLVARDTAGVLYRLPGNGKGGFGARVKIAGGWQGYKGIF